MSIPTTSPSPADDAFEGGPLEDAAFETMRADAVLTGRNMGAGAHIAGILSGAQAATAPTPAALLKDVWPDVDPVVVQAIYERGVEVGWRGHALYQAPRFRGAELAEAQESCARAGFMAMQGAIGRSRELAGRQHPADGEAGHGH
ncbi:hypothetical protein ACWDVX_33330 [Streptomyces tendae]